MADVSTAGGQKSAHRLSASGTGSVLDRVGVGLSRVVVKDIASEYDGELVP